jgi:hypothetical protein
MRYLGPGQCRVHIGLHGALTATVLGDRTYGGVYAAYLFPVRHPDRYIALIQSVEDGSGNEIGVIRSLDEFAPDQAKLIREALKRRYFVHSIRRINHIGWKYGFVAIDADTDKGHVDFLMRWQQDRAVNYGKAGKVLIDVNNNRFLIPDVEALSAGERSKFLRVIYW